MSHVFISYSRKHQAYVGRLANDLRRNGFDVRIDDRIDYGERWWRTIVEAIKACGAFVVVMTPDAKKIGMDGARNFVGTARPQADFSVADYHPIHRYARGSGAARLRLSCSPVQRQQTF